MMFILVCTGSREISLCVHERSTLPCIKARLLANFIETRESSRNNLDTLTNFIRLIAQPVEKPTFYPWVDSSSLSGPTSQYWY